MKLLGIGILRFNADCAEPIMLIQASELSSFGYFQRGTVKEMLTFFSKTIAQRTAPGQRQSVQNNEHYVHVYMRSDGLCGCVTCDSEYTVRVAFSILTNILEDFAIQNPTWEQEKRTEAISWPPLEAALQKYQDTANADQIIMIQKNLDDTREVLHTTIDQVLERGVKLDDLVQRSADLSAQSKKFYDYSRKANGCCSVL